MAKLNLNIGSTNETAKAVESIITGNLPEPGAKTHYTVAEFIDALAKVNVDRVLHGNTIRKYIKRGEIASEIWGGKTRIPVTELERYLKEGVTDGRTQNGGHSTKAKKGTVDHRKVENKA